MYLYHGNSLHFLSVFVSTFIGTGIGRLAFHIGKEDEPLARRRLRWIHFIICWETERGKKGIIISAEQQQQQE